MLERSGLRIEHFFLGSGLNSPRKKKFFFVLILPYFAWKNWFGANLITRRVGAEHPSPPRGSAVWMRGCVCASTRGRVDASTGPFFCLLLLDKSRKLSKIVSVLQSASVERFDVSRMRDFFFLFCLIFN